MHARLDGLAASRQNVVLSSLKESETAMKVTRSMQRRYDQLDAIATKERNRGRKERERDRRDARMRAAVQAASLPYPPHVMSWLSRQLGKPSSLITTDDVRTLVG